MPQEGNGQNRLSSKIPPSNKELENHCRDIRVNTEICDKRKGNFLSQIFALLSQQSSLAKKHRGCTFQKRFPHNGCCLRMSLQFLPVLKLNFPFSLLGKYQYSNGSLPTRSWSAPQKERVYS